MTFEATETVSCNLCGDESYEVVFAQDRHGFGLKTVMCSGCGLFYFNPRPTAASYLHFYQDGYQRLYPRSVSWLWSDDGRGLNRQAALERARYYRQFVTEGSRLLEIGSGDGSFLLAAAQEVGNLAAIGIEASPQAAELSRTLGANVINTTIDKLADENFAAIAAFHVLEHLADPLGTLRSAYQRLSPDGFLFLEVPDIAGNWSGLGMIHVAHPHMFTEATLCYAMRLAGFDLVAVDRLRDSVFACSIRAVGRKRAAPPTRVSPPPMPTPEEIRAFHEKLAGWRRQRFRYRVTDPIVRLSARMQRLGERSGQCASR